MTEDNREGLSDTALESEHQAYREQQLNRANKKAGVVQSNVLRQESPQAYWERVAKHGTFNPNLPETPRAEIRTTREAAGRNAKKH